MDNKKNHKNGNTRKKRRRVIALLNRAEMEYLERLGMDSLFSTGRKLSRVEIIAALVNAAIVLNISANGVKNKYELIQRILEVVRQNPDKERREFPRLKKHLHVKFRKMDSMEQYKGGATNNIGKGGFRIDVAFLGQPLAVNQVIETTIEDPQGESKSIKAIGRVAWVKDINDGHSHEIGVMLTYIKKEDEKRFFKYVSEETETKTETKEGGGAHNENP
jgi:hypothetical protein